MPVGGLRQDQLHFDRPLHFMDIINSPAGGLRHDGHSRAVARHFVAAAIQYLHPSAVYSVFGAGFEERFAMPTIDVLPPRKTPVHLLSAVFENEGTISGTARVHVDIFLKQLGLGCPQEEEGSVEPGSADGDDDAYLDTAPEFRDELFLAYGDQMTAARIRGVKLGQRSARRAFDRRDWLLGPPVWFHTLQAVLNLIIKSHWEPLKSGQFSRATLVHDISYLDRHGISKDNFKYHQIQPIVTQGFRARVAALFYRSLQDTGQLEQAALPVNTSTTSIGSREVHERYFDVYDRAVRELGADEFEAYVDAVCDRAFSRDAWLGKEVEDLEFVTMCRFLHEALLFLQLQHAVKYGDIGALQRLVDPLAVVFLGGNQHLYSFEMLHLRWLLEHAEPELQRAVLACGLVNERGRPDTFKAADLVLEHFNLEYAGDMQKLKNSTHDVVATFIRGSLAHDELRQVRAAFELNYGVRISSLHSYKRAEADVFNLAVFLNREGCTVSSVPSERERGRMFLSRDLYSIGVELLPAKVQKFNAEMVRLPEAAGEALRLAMVGGRDDDGDGDAAGAGDDVEGVDPDVAAVHESVLDAVAVADYECYLDADVEHALECHMERVVGAS